MTAEKNKTSQTEFMLELKQLSEKITEHTRKRKISSRNENENLRLACYFLREALSLLNSE